MLIEQGVAAGMQGVLAIAQLPECSIYLALSYYSSPRANRITPKLNPLSWVADTVYVESSCTGARRSSKSRKCTDVVHSRTYS